MRSCMLMHAIRLIKSDGMHQFITICFLANLISYSLSYSFLFILIILSLDLELTPSGKI